MGPCESSRPEVSENVVLFGRASFLTGVIAAQSQIMSAKVEASPKLGGVKKKDTATISVFGLANESAWVHDGAHADSVPGPKNQKMTQL